MDPLRNLQTEARNPASARLDELTSLELVDLFLTEDAGIAPAMRTQHQAIAQAIDVIASRLGAGGRLIYLGAGTSGRLGVLDASECPPTFQTPHEQIVGLIAGGAGAMFKAVEGAEDSAQLGIADLRALHLTDKDVVCGIASSGSTHYVLGAIRYAKEVGAFTIGVACNTESELERAADLAVIPVVGPEVLSGSTRLKAGTATKLVLNMFTTGAMVRLGKTFGNLMIDLKASNAKLKLRANGIVRTITGIEAVEAETLLVAAGGEVKTAILMKLAGLEADAARSSLLAAGSRIKQALGELGKPKTIASSRNATERPHRPDLVLGIDGGGTSTIVLLADAAKGTVLGRGVSGPSNIQSVGVDTGLKALDDGIERAFAAAGIPVSRVGSIALGLAGVDRQEGHDVIQGWSARRRIADRATIANDATLLLAAGTPDGWGLAVIAGTGSIAFVRNPQGLVGRAGGWGHTLGDDGSAYNLALQGLRAACRAADKVDRDTVLLTHFLKKMNLASPPDLIPAIYRGPWDRTAIAALAPIVLEAAERGDATARNLVDSEAEQLARTAAAAVRNHGLPTTLPVALAGGLLLGSELYRTSFSIGLARCGIFAQPLALVPDPALGAVVLARRQPSRPE